MLNQCGKFSLCLHVISFTLKLYHYHVSISSILLLPDLSFLTYSLPPILFIQQTLERNLHSPQAALDHGIQATHTRLVTWWKITEQSTHAQEPQHTVISMNPTCSVVSVKIIGRQRTLAPVPSLPPRLPPSPIPKQDVPRNTIPATSTVQVIKSP
jgi:hypothetical protein